MRRLENSRRMLRDNPHLSIGAIATATGFPSSQKFATVFKRYNGCSPSAFRAQMSDPKKGSWTG